jgi:hypothetical protein
MMSKFVPPTLADFWPPLLGALRLARFDLRGLTYMDSSPRGAQLSFLAPFAMLPVILWLTLQDSAINQVEIDNEALCLIRQTLGYAVVVFGFPLAMHYLAPMMKCDNRYLLMVSAINWITVVQSLLLFIGSLTYLWDWVPQTLGGLILMAISTYCVFYLWFTLRHALGISGNRALGLVGLMTLIQLIGMLMTQI